MIPTRITLIAFGAALLLAGTSAAQSSTTEADSTDVARVDTYDGTISIVQLTHPARARQFRVRLGSDVVFRDSVSLTVMLHTLTSWSGRRVALLELASGGTGCPSMYRIVEFSEERRPRVSAEFGNCSDLPVVLLDGTRFRVRFPGFYTNYQARQPGFRPPPAATWEYLGDGRVRRVTGAATGTR
ncbi:MAG TPA: hypothetical protein VFS20_03710 [Longimicrobium sp.]|nr:hypothetical protein [Longimicrobium sp.]